MTEPIYRQLQKRLDLYSMGFPKAGSGIELDILKYLFNEGEASLFLALSPALETPEAISKRMGGPLEENGMIHADLDRCIGCGLCVTTCPAQVLELLVKPDTEHQTPPASMGEQMMGMARSRGTK